MVTCSSPPDLLLDAASAAAADGHPPTDIPQSNNPSTLKHRMANPPHGFNL
jgi:hypothetical protein